MPHQPDSRIEIQVLKKRIVEALETFTIEELRRLVADIEERLRESERGGLDTACSDPQCKRRSLPKVVLYLEH
jgi:hypothetical protein